MVADGYRCRMAAYEHDMAMAMAVDGCGMAATMAADEHDMAMAADGCGMAASMAADEHDTCI